MKRSNFWPSAGVALGLMPIAMVTEPAARAKSELIWVGTYTNTTSRGIYAVELDSESGRLSQPALAAAVSNPSFLAVSPNGARVYAVEETAAGRIDAFRVEPRSLRLSRINSQPTAGNGPAHVALAWSGAFGIAVAANYGGGSVASFPLAADGSVLKKGSFYAHHGPPGPDRARQMEPHPHSVTFSPDGRFALVCDLGLDRVLIYRVDAARGALTPAEPASAAVPPGAGPRHSVFSPDGRFWYVINEMAGTVCGFGWDAGAGRLTLHQTIRTDFAGDRPAGAPDAEPKASSAEIAVSPDGRFLYASNRGPNTIAVFGRDAAGGALRLSSVSDCGGNGPRSFALSPNGRWLICANQLSDNLAVFRVDRATGGLAQTGESVAIGRPVSVVFSQLGISASSAR